MRYSIEKLMRDVMARLGEFPRPQTSLDAGSWADAIPWPEDVVALKVGSLLPEVGGRLLREAHEALPGGEAVGSAVEGEKRLMPCGLHAAEVALPEDFLRLGSVKMGEWRHSVSDAASSGDSGWERQWSPEAGIAGCPERPRVYLDRDAEGRLLRLVGSRSAYDEVEWLRIWRVPAPDSDGRFEFPAVLYGDLISSIAATF